MGQYGSVDDMKLRAVDFQAQQVNFDELFLGLGLEKVAKIRTLMENVGDFREAMHVTESSAAQSIQNLEIITSVHP